MQSYFFTFLVLACKENHDTLVVMSKKFRLSLPCDCN
jgi:hypothetical protein